jgi:hypothetical protein
MAAPSAFLGLVGGELFPAGNGEAALELEVYEEAISAEAPLGLSIGQVWLK